MFGLFILTHLTPKLPIETSQLICSANQLTVLFMMGPFAFTELTMIADLRILKGKKHPKIKLQRLQKVRIWAFGSLVHQINFL